MTKWTRATIPREWLVGLLAIYLVGFAYLIMVAQQLLLGILLGGVIITLYIVWRFLVAIEAIADAHQRIAQQQELE